MPSVGDHQDPGDLTVQLAAMTEQLQALSARGTGVEPHIWKSRLTATVTNPRMGTVQVNKGEVGVSPQGWASGAWDLRISGAARTRGNGTYMLDLPYPASVTDARGYTDIGGGVIGVDVTHKVFRLNTCGIPSHRSASKAVMTIEDGLFATHASPFPGEDIDNIHFSFGYWIADTE